MISIPQYGSMPSIYICIMAIIPCIVLGLAGKKSKIMNLIVSIVMILLILGLHSLKLFQFVLFMIFETAITYFYLYFRKKSNSELIYHFVFFLTLIPILVVRMSFLNPTVASYFGFTGLSYLCFKIWQIIMEIHDGKIESISLVNYFGLLLFFPSFSSGPIARYQGFIEESESNVAGMEYIEKYVIPGVKKIIIGLFYKFAIAFAINTLFMAKISDERTIFNIVRYMYTYTLYLFFDFAGYSSIAIGVGMLMGIKLPENFNKPFLSRNMKEFWTRWHMSLSTWFGDYVYGRFVLNNVRNGLFRNPKKASRWGLLFTMTVMGIWHGFNAHYIIYGIYEGILLVLTDIYLKSKHYRKMKKKPYYNNLSRIICFQFISIGMLLFSGKFM